MAYCPRCGTAANSQFCGACGAPVAFSAYPASGPIPQTAFAPARRRRRWPWFAGLGLVIWLGGAYYFYLDNERTFAEARNRGVDILSTDEKTGVVTARDKQTGKIIKMDFNDLESDQIRVGLIGMPSWIPSYPNIADSAPSTKGSYSFSTPDSVAQAAGFYQTELRKAGMKITRRDSSSGGALESVAITAAHAASDRSVTVSVKREGAGTGVVITPGGE